MAYQHANRLTAHWQPKNLTPSARSVALYLAQNIRGEGNYAGLFFNSGEQIALALQINPSSAYSAVRQLLAAGYFTYQVLPEHARTGLRTFSLALDCPPTCPNIQTHYSALELAARPQLTEIDLSDFLEYSDTPVKFSQANTLTPVEFPRAYKELTNKEIDLDIEPVGSKFSETELAARLEKVILTLVETHLQTSDTSINHTRLLEAVTNEPRAVALKAVAIIAERQPKNPEAYIRSIVANDPGALLEVGENSSYPVAIVSLFRNNLDAIEAGHRSSKLFDHPREYGTYLIENGFVPSELIEIAKARANDRARALALGKWNTLADLVGECIGATYGLEYKSGFSGAEDRFSRLDLFGNDAQAYALAVERSKARLDYKALAETDFEDYLRQKYPGQKNLHSVKTREDYFTYQTLDEQYAEANPALYGEAEYYNALIEPQLSALDPNAPTLEEWLKITERETTEQLLEKTLAEWSEFWNAYPARADGRKGTEYTAAQAWIKARHSVTANGILEHLKDYAYATDREYVKFPNKWLEVEYDLNPDKASATADPRPKQWG
jgi:hypothetical protein